MTNRRTNIMVEKRELTTDIRRIKAELDATMFRLSELQREGAALAEREAPRTMVHSPIQVPKYTCNTAPPNSTIQVDHLGIPIGKYDLNGQPNYAIHDVHVVDRVRPRVEKHMEELKARRLASGNSIFWKNQQPSKIDYAFAA